MAKRVRDTIWDATLRLPQIFYNQSLSSQCRMQMRQLCAGRSTDLGNTNLTLAYLFDTLVTGMVRIGVGVSLLHNIVSTGDQRLKDNSETCSFQIFPNSEQPPLLIPYFLFKHLSTLCTHQGSPFLKYVVSIYGHCP